MVELRTEHKWVAISHGPLDILGASRFLARPQAGGIAIFEGITREWTDGRQTVTLEYDCYEPMALKEMDRLVEEAFARWDATAVVLHHRTGVVPVSDRSVLIGVASPHRSDAFEACRYIIDTLKETVPIWKRENYIDGTSEWVGSSSESSI